jgi:hypothetical protein
MKNMKSNIDDINKNLEKLVKKVPEKADAIVAKYSVVLHGYLVARSPVDTGNLQANWQNQKIDTAKRIVSNNTEYIIDTEYSTKSPHKGWIDKTVADAEKEINRLILEDIKKFEF